MASNEPKLCPEGTYNEGAGAMSATDCKDCPEGVFCKEKGHAYAPIYISGADLDVCASTQTDTPNC